MGYYWFFFLIIAHFQIVLWPYCVCYSKLHFSTTNEGKFSGAALQCARTKLCKPEKLHLWDEDSMQNHASSSPQKKTLSMESVPVPQKGWQPLLYYIIKSDWPHLGWRVPYLTCTGIMVSKGQE